MVVDRDARATIEHPQPGLHIVGETYSDAQCWCEGALRSAKRAVRRLIAD